MDGGTYLSEARSWSNIPPPAVHKPKRSNITKMKRQRNTQQVKEQERCPPNQTKEEEIENLPDKEFQILIVKMIQNLEIKMESEIVWRQGLRRCKKGLTRT